MIVKTALPPEKQLARETGGGEGWGAEWPGAEADIPNLCKGLGFTTNSYVVWGKLISMNHSSSSGKPR